MKVKDIIEKINKTETLIVGLQDIWETTEDEGVETTCIDTIDTLKAYIEILKDMNVYG